jgi:hypothetical protein
MAGWSPTLEGFRTMLRRPSLSLAEVIWRFSFGAAASVLFGLATIAYLDTIPVTGGDLRMLRTGHPLLVAQAIAHISRGTALRVVIANGIRFRRWRFSGSWSLRWDGLPRSALCFPSSASALTRSRAQTIPRQRHLICLTQAPPAIFVRWRDFISCE